MLLEAEGKILKLLHRYLIVILASVKYLKDLVSMLLTNFEIVLILVELVVELLTGD